MSSLGYGAAQCIIHFSVGSMSVMEGGYQNYLAAASNEINITYPIDRDYLLEVFFPLRQGR